MYTHQSDKQRFYVAECRVEQNRPVNEQGRRGYEQDDEDRVDHEFLGYMAKSNCFFNGDVVVDFVLTMRVSGSRGSLAGTLKSRSRMMRRAYMKQSVDMIMKAVTSPKTAKSRLVAIAAMMQKNLEN